MRTAPTGDETSPDLPAGALVGEYRIERKLKQGGMGTVYEAVHTVIHKRAAVKVLKRELCENAETVHRFVQEARAVNRIGHPNIVDVFGFGVTEDGRSFLAMELLVGQTLGERMTAGPIRRAEACELLLEITHALEAAHRGGVVHRDLKPENVFLAVGRGGQPIVKLLDFGIAKLTGGGGMTGAVDVTQPGTLIGTPKYIAPEQARGLSVDGAADVYSLGVILFELLVGRAPFVGDDPVEMIAKHITLKPPRPSDFDRTLPPLADELAGTMLDKVPAARPGLGRVRELLEQLRRAPDADAEVLSARRSVTTIVSADIERAPTVSGRRRWWWIAVPALLVLAVGVRGVVWIADRSSTDRVMDAGSALQLAPVVTPIDDTTPTQSPTPNPDAADEAPIAIPIPTPRPHHPAGTPKPLKPHAPPAAETKPTPPEPPRPPPPDDDDGLKDPFHH